MSVDSMPVDEMHKLTLKSGLSTNIDNKTDNKHNCLLGGGIFNGLTKLDEIQRAASKASDNPSMCLFIVSHLSTAERLEWLADEDKGRTAMRGTKNEIGLLKTLGYHAKLAIGIITEFVPEDRREAYMQQFYLCGDCEAAYAGDEPPVSIITSGMPSWHLKVTELLHAIHKGEFDDTIKSMHRAQPDVTVDLDMKFGTLGEEITKIQQTKLSLETPPARVPEAPRSAQTTRSLSA